MKLRPAVAGLLLAAIAAAPLFSQDKLDALELFRQNKFAEAIKVCQQELAVSPNNIDSHVVMGWSYLNLQQYQGALDIAQEALAINPNDPRVIQIIGEAEVFLGKIGEALLYLQQYVALRPSGDRIARVYWLMGECYLRLKEYQNADIALSTAVYYSQSSAQWWTRLGYARELASDLKWALEAYTRALKLDAGLVDALRGKDSVEKKLKGG